MTQMAPEKARFCSVCKKPITVRLLGKNLKVSLNRYCPGPSGEKLIKVQFPSRSRHTQSPHLVRHKSKAHFSEPQFYYQYHCRRREGKQPFWQRSFFQNDSFFSPSSRNCPAYKIDDIVNPFNPRRRLVQSGPQFYVSLLESSFLPNGHLGWIKTVLGRKPRCAVSTSATVLPWLKSSIPPVTVLVTWKALMYIFAFKKKVIT